MNIVLLDLNWCQVPMQYVPVSGNALSYIHKILKFTTETNTPLPKQNVAKHFICQVKAWRFEIMGFLLT